MPQSCCAVGCAYRKRKDDKIGFFSIPKQEPRRSQWLVKLKRGTSDHQGGLIQKLWEPKGHERVCGKHFVKGKPSDDRLDIDYLPSQFDFSVTTPQTKRHRHDRYRAREQTKRELPMPAEEPVDANTVVMEHAHTNVDEVDPTDELRAINTSLTEKVGMLEIEIGLLKSEKEVLEKKIANLSINAESMNDKKVSFYTGIPTLAVFTFIVGLVAPFIKVNRKLSVTNQVLIVLMKLRHGLKNTDLAYRFGVSTATISNILNDVIPTLATRLLPLIQWPSADVLRRNLPQKFLHRFQNCVSIIDCSEWFVERPYNLSARARTWSNYKHHHTMKFFISITPYGAINFVSKCWGGRISDKEITARCGFYSKLKHGDQVMADRGFTISHELATRGATLVMPPFLAGRKQLPGRIVHRARQISALRIHIERAIERVKNFTILKQTLSLNMVPHASDMLIICSAITNLQPKLIK